MLSLRQASSRSTSSASLSAAAEGKSVSGGSRRLHLHLLVAVLLCRRRRHAVLTWAAAVGGGLRHAQDALKLLLEAVRPLQERLQPVDELCADDVLRVEDGGWA